ncbi:LolA family protein [Streptomyces sp. O3]
MAPNGPDQRPLGDDVTDDMTDDLRTGRRKAARYIVPVAVAGVAAATIGLVPALASSGDPDLPKITAQELIEKIAASDTEQLSGSIKISTDLGIPGLGGAASSLLGEAGESPEGGASVAPQDKLLELASGTHTLRVAADGPDKQKLSILDDAAEYSVIRNGDDVWAYDSASNEAYHATTEDGGKHPRGKGEDGDGDGGLPESAPATPKEFAEQALKAADDTTSVSVDGTAKVAGRDAYQLLIEPKESDGVRSTIGAIRIAVDADNGVPLKFTLTPSGGGKAAIDAGFTKVDFSAPKASTFDFKPAKGMKVTEADELDERAPGGGEDSEGPEGFDGLEDLGGLNVIGEGWSSIAAFDLPGGQGFAVPENGDVPPEAEQFLDALGDKVTGKFGSGTVFSTRLVNALITDDGKVYVGAVDKASLVKAANEAK